jgi:hypothetical protein
VLLQRCWLVCLQLPMIWVIAYTPDSINNERRTSYKNELALTYLVQAT